jgi:hypothetical protein
MDKEELEEIEKIADEDLFEFDSDLDITDNLILFGRRLLFRIVAVGFSLLFLLISNLYFFHPRAFSTLFNIKSEYVENYYLYDLGPDLLIEYSVPDVPTMKHSGRIYFLSSKSKDPYSDGFSHKVSPGRIVYPPKRFEDLDANVKVIKPDNKKLKIYYLGEKQIILKIRESTLRKGMGLKNSDCTISDIYLGEKVKYKRSER